MPPRKPAKGDCKLHCCTVSDEVGERIRQSVEDGRGKSMFESVNPRMHAAMCRCGVPRKSPGIMRHVNDDGLCVVHPDAPVQPWVRGAGGSS